MSGSGIGLAADEGPEAPPGGGEGGVSASLREDVGRSVGCGGGERKRRAEGRGQPRRGPVITGASPSRSAFRGVSYTSMTAAGAKWRLTGHINIWYVCPTFSFKSGSGHCYGAEQRGYPCGYQTSVACALWVET
eukprot:2549400-Rhodomonas_salina.1